MNLQIALAVALLAVTASTQARMLMPTQPSGEGTVRQPAGIRTMPRPPIVNDPFRFPQSAIAVPPKSAVTLPADFPVMSTPDPHPEKSAPLTTPPPRNGPILFPGPTRQPPVVPETSTNVPAPHCHGKNAC